MAVDSLATEIDTAVRVVHLASSLCVKVQEKLRLPSSTNGGHVKSKDDDSPVTVADWGVQAIVSWVLAEVFGDENLSIVAEEDTESLSEADSLGLLGTVSNAVNEALLEASSYGLPEPDKPLESNDILKAIGRCSSVGGPKGRHWVLDPVDGTLGFVRDDQYAVALALIENGQVLLGVLGCPNYPLKKECLSNGCNQTAKREAGSVLKGCVMYAKRGSGQAWMQPLIAGGIPESATLLKVSSVDDPVLATVCEPVERANSNHLFTAGLANSMGVRKQPMRVYSMVKYAAIARGDAEVFMKFAQSSYKEKIWDHAAGVVIVEEAGGVVTDAGGRNLDFSKGVYLEGLDRGIIACSGQVLHEKIIGAVYASWESSSL
ncbi:unnamed protein product [Cochlearia groenlandica]